MTTLSSHLSHLGGKNKIENCTGFKLWARSVHQRSLGFPGHMLKNCSYSPKLCEVVKNSVLFRDEQMPQRKNDH